MAVRSEDAPAMMMEHRTDAAGSDVPNVEAIMERIRSEVRAAAMKRDDRFGSPSAYPRPVGAGAAAPGAFSPIIYREELRYLNDNWHSWVTPEAPVSHRRFYGRFIVRAKRFVLDAVWNYILKGYFERERQFQMNLVRFLNELARHVDQRDADVFWQLVKKLDNDIVGVNERTDLLFDDAAARFGRDLIRLSGSAGGSAPSDGGRRLEIEKSGDAPGAAAKAPHDMSTASGPLSPTRSGGSYDLR